MANNFEVDKYLSDVYSDELIPDWYEEEITWMDELGVFPIFRASVERVRRQLAENGDHYSFEQIERALRFWLEENVSSLVKDAPDQIMRGLNANSFYAALRREEPTDSTQHFVKGGDEYSGLTAFRPDALKEMILFYASKPFGVLKTKLNKLLWYADFLHYRLHGVSISGATYIHLPFGPVPDQYEKYLSSLIEHRDLNIEAKEIGDFQGVNLTSRRPPAIDRLPGSALAVLESVFGRLGGASSSEVSRLSHEEAAYKDTRPGERISYHYAAALKLKTGSSGARVS